MIAVSVWEVTTTVGAPPPPPLPPLPALPPQGVFWNNFVFFALVQIASRRHAHHPTRSCECIHTRKHRCQLEGLHRGICIARLSTGPLIPASGLSPTLRDIILVFCPTPPLYFLLCHTTALPPFLLSIASCTTL